MKGAISIRLVAIGIDFFLRNDTVEKAHTVGARKMIQWDLTKKESNKNVTIRLSH